jgi:hypothetical protein
VLIHIGVTPKKDKWEHLCVGNSCGESKIQAYSRRIFRTILRTGHHVEPVEVGVLREVVSEIKIIVFCKKGK